MWTSRSYGFGSYLALTESRSIGADGDLDLVTVGVLEKCRVGAGAVGATFARLGDAGAAGADAVLVGRLHRDDAEPAHAEQAVSRLRVVVGGDEEHRFRDAPTDRFVLVEMAPPTQRGEHRVVERGP